MAKQHYKQKYEYQTVMVYGKKSKSPYMTSASSTNITISVHPPQEIQESITTKINATLQKYAEVGWRFKGSVTIDDDVVLVFERPTEDYESYTSELKQYIEE